MCHFRKVPAADIGMQWHVNRKKHEEVLGAVIQCLNKALGIKKHPMLTLERKIKLFSPSLSIDDSACHAVSCE